MHQHEPVGGKLLTPTFLVALALAAVGAFFIAERFTGGLGAVANINDAYPWGIWVTIDVVVGTAFGCAGYAIALVVYILNKGEYHPLVRPALLASLFGYGLAGLAVLIDLGRYWHFYHMFMPWLANTNSVMLEVGLCVAAYTGVLFVEFLPAFLEKFGLRCARKTLNKALFIFIAAGVLLPTMHQSSLGSMLVILGQKVSPLWQTQFLPVLFLASALLMGFAFVIVESILASLAFNRPLETPILGKLTGLMSVLLAGFVALRVLDLVFRGAFGHAFAGDLRATMFWIELALHVLPLVLMLPAGSRRSPRTLFAAAGLLLAGGILYRINAYLVGYEPVSIGWHYFPSVKEILVTVGIFSFEVVLYHLFVKRLPVLPKPEHA
ncbi:MAG TPA: Ni/Fe-hydrogenase cytochrome b subunit [Azospirillaceae bacterium]|nr:Ni/Fe-hydrogenase cytochrome b subunit [Azospirillaceae bacterium]